MALTDEINQLAQAVASDVKTLQGDLSSKVDSVPGKQLSSEDYTTAEKNKLDGVEAGAQVNLTSVDALTSNSTTLPLSANQGRVLKGLIDNIETLLESDDTTLDELQEIVDFIKLNRDELDSLGIQSISGLADALDSKQPLSSVLTNTTAAFTTALNTKLGGIATGATKNDTDANLRNRANHTGTQAASTITGLATVATSGSYADLSNRPTIPTIPGVATTTTNGLMSSGDKVKLNGVATGATANATDAALRARSSHTGTQPASTITGLADVATSGSYSDLSGTPTIPSIPGVATPTIDGLMASGDKAKLDGVEEGSTSNSTDAYLLSRANHTGSQAISTITGLSAAIDSKVDKVVGKGLSTEDYTSAEKTKLSGVESGAQVNLVPVDSLTSDDAALPLSANQGSILKGLIDSINTLLQSDDSSLDELQEIVNFIKLNRDDLDNLGISSIAGLTDALAGKQPLSSVLTGTTASFTTALKTKVDGVEAQATKNETDAYLLNRSNHTGTQAASTITGLTKTTVGLGNVDNTSDENKPISTAQQSALSDKVDKVTGKGLSTEDYTTVEKNKLSGVAAGATTNATDAALRARSSHTGTQAASTITGLSSVATSGSYGDLSGTPTIPTIPGVATTSSNGLMSSVDKTRLDEMYSGGEALVWLTQPIGGLVTLWDHIQGCPIPPNDAQSGPCFIKLSAADAHNAGLLSGETVSGTSPTITATAEINLARSPLHGQTVSLINTEERFLRAGVSGALQDSTNLAHSHSGSSASAGSHSHTGSSGSTGSHSHTGTAASSGAHSHTGSSASAGAHTHTYTGPSILNLSLQNGTTQYGFRVQTANTNSGSSGAHSHAITVASGGAHTHSISTNSTGSHSHTITVGSGGSHSHSITVAEAGDAEARPRNIGATYYMRIA